MQDLEENHEFKPENIVKKILSLVLAAICIGASVVMFLWITIPSSPIAPHDIENWKQPLRHFGLNFMNLTEVDG